MTALLPALSRRERTGSLSGMQNAFPHSFIYEAAAALI
jgi:hypothetical protein